MNLIKSTLYNISFIYTLKIVYNKKLQYMYKWRIFPVIKFFFQMKSSVVFNRKH